MTMAADMPVAASPPDASRPSRLARLLAWLAALGLCLLVGWPLAAVVQGWIETQDQIALVSDKLEQVQARRRDPKPLADQAGRLASEASATAGYLDAPDQAAAATMLEQIATGVIASQQGQITMLQRAPNLAEGPALALRLQTSCVLPSASLRPLLHAIETASPALFVEQATIERGGNGLVTLTLRLRAYWIAP